jgi:hypothetical protein
VLVVLTVVRHGSYQIAFDSNLMGMTSSYP